MLPAAPTAAYAEMAGSRRLQRAFPLVLRCGTLQGYEQ
jgi:hypothetical protein